MQGLVNYDQAQVGIGRLLPAAPQVQALLCQVDLKAGEARELLVLGEQLAEGRGLEGIPEGPTTPDLEWPTWMVYSAIPLGTSLMCFRFLQVMVNFLKTGELPHHDHGHVDGLEDETPPVDTNPYAMNDNLHPTDL